MGSAYHISVTSSQILVASNDRCEGVGMLDIVRDDRDSQNNAQRAAKNQFLVFYGAIQRISERVETTED